MIEKIIADSKQMEKEALVDEKDAQTAYENFIKDSNNAITANLKSIATKTGEKSSAEEEKVGAESDLAETMSDLDKLKAYNSDLHSSCDFTTENFEIRQEARDQEIEALKQ